VSAGIVKYFNASKVLGMIERIRTYKDGQRLTKIRFDSMFKLKTGVATESHSAKILKGHCRLNLRRNFFSE